MRLIHDNGTKRFQFPALSALPGFFHGVFLRETADKRGRRVSFNLGMGNGASDTAVRANREKMMAIFGTGLRGIYGRQVHGKEIGVLTRDAGRKSLESTRADQLDGDALITDLEGAALAILVADCQAVMIIDPVERVVANIHSGWRGSVQNIIGATIGRMVDDFGCLAKNMVCGIGPSLGPCCAEFVNYKDELPETFWKYQHANLRFDFWQASTDQLIDAGVQSDSISTSGFCTRCNPHLFFSYRGERHTGRFAAVVGIEPGKGGGR